MKNRASLLYLVPTALTVAAGLSFAASQTAPAALTTYQGAAPGWTHGVQSLAFTGQEPDVLISGRVTDKGDFSLSFSADTKMLNEYVRPVTMQVPTGQWCFYDSCNFKISDPKGGFLKVEGVAVDAPGALGNVYVEHRQAEPDPRFKELSRKVTKTIFVYADRKLDIQGQAVSKAQKLKLVYDLKLPAGWSVMEEVGEYTLDDKGEVAGTIRTYRSVPAPTTPWTVAKLPG